MIIKTITLSQHNIPLKHPFITALRRVDAVAFLRVKVETDCGKIGIGEAPPTKAITGDTLESISEAIATLKPKLIDVSVQQALHEVLTCKANNSAKAALDIALHNLIADNDLKKSLGAQVSTLKTAITISLDTPQQMAERAKEALERGLDILKVKVGGDDGRDIERIEAVCAVARDAKILLDANQAWSIEEAHSIIEKISPLNIELIEQPLIAGDLKGMAELTCKSTIPILADESAFDLEDVKKVLAHKAAHMINIKLMKCGGITPAIAIIKHCQKHGITCMMGSMLEGPNSIIAAAALAMAYPDTIQYIDLDSPLLYTDVTLAKPLTFHHNTLSL